MTKLYNCDHQLDGWCLTCVSVMDKELRDTIYEAITLRKKIETLEDENKTLLEENQTLEDENYRLVYDIGDLQSRVEDLEDELEYDSDKQDSIS